MKRLISSLLIFSFLFSILGFRVSAEIYTLAPGDTLEIKIIGKPKFDTKQSIAPDGKINLPLLGRLTVQGYTIVKPQVVIYLIPRPIYIIQHDVKKNTWEVKEAKSIEEARALAGKDYEGEIRYGDIITVEISKKADFFESNWYRIITAAAVLVGIYATLNR